MSYTKWLKINRYYRYLHFSFVYVNTFRTHIPFNCGKITDNLILMYNFSGIPLYVFGPETHMTAIVGMALGTRPIPQENLVDTATANFALPSGETQPNKRLLNAEQKDQKKAPSHSTVANAQVIYDVLNLYFFLLNATTNIV